MAAGKKTQAAAPLIPAVIYARYSSSGQREESIEGQLRECHEFARRNGLTVVGEYIDKALTGRSDKRPDFQRMLRDCERGVFKAVICWKTDRFARNRYDSAMYKYKLKKYGVRIFYAKETIPEGPEGIILESVMEGYAEYYSENLSQNVKRGFYDSALELKTLGQTVIGLRKGPDGRFEIDPATAPVVRRIFEEYAAGESAKDIYTRLNNEGYRTSRGGLFNKNSLRRILQNEKYVGVYEFRDIRVEDAIPAIVSRELFDKCQLMVEKHHRAPAAQRETSFLLTSKLFCGHCGEPMTGDGGTSRTGRVYYYYTCNGRRAHKCEKERAPKAWIEQLVVNELVDLIHSDDFVNEVADRCMEFQQREQDKSALHALEARQKENAKAIQNMLAAIEAGIITPSTKSRLMELEAERAQIEKGIAQQLISEPALERDQVVYFLERFRNGDVNDDMYRAFLVDTFLNAVYLYDDDKLVLVLNYTGERCKVTLELVEKAVKGDPGGGSCFAPSGAWKRACNYRLFFHFGNIVNGEAMKNWTTFRYAFQKSLPVMAGYLVLGMGFGMMLEAAGYGIGWALAMSIFIYAGSMQYVVIDLLTGGASLITTALMTVAVNIRHLFYGISMVEQYQNTRPCKPYLIFALTDETYSLVCSGEVPEGISWKWYCFFLSLLNQCYWVAGSAAGSVFGSFGGFSTEGIDFSMTALFLVVFLEQWKSTKDHASAVLGVFVSFVCLILFGPEGFLIPSLIMIPVFLTAARRFRGKEGVSDGSVS